MWFADIGLADLEQVGGKNSSLGEMIGNLSAAGGLLLRQAQPDGGQHGNDLLAYRLGVLPGATDHDHEVVGITHDAIGGQAVAPAPSPVHPGGHVGLPGVGEMLVQHRQGDVG
jgi:hypothetical protein